MSTTALRALAASCHAVLIAAVAALMLRAIDASPAREIALAAALLPLLLTLRGALGSRPRAAQWLSVLLVVYAGGAAVEVVASLGRAWPASIALLAALSELAVLLSLIRRNRARPRAPG